LFLLPRVEIVDVADHQGARRQIRQVDTLIRRPPHQRLPQALFHLRDAAAVRSGEPTSRPLTGDMRRIVHSDWRALEVFMNGRSEAG
jgi:hypothetical protein